MKAFHALFIGLATLGVVACSSMPQLGGSQSNTASTTAMAGAPVTTTAAAGKPTVNTSGNVNAVINAFVVRQANGKETLEPVTQSTTIQKGDLVEYHGLFTNAGKDRVRNMDVTMSIPQGVAFTGVLDPALGAKASLDGNQFVHAPIRVNVDGAIQNVPFAQYQALRWTIEEVGIGATAVVKYRATVQ